MRLSIAELRASVVAIAKDVAEAYARFDPPLDDDVVEERFARLPGVHAAIAGRLAAAQKAVSAEFGDGVRATILIACGIVQAALDRLPAEGRGNFASAIDVATGRPAEWVERNAKRLNTPAEVERAVTTSAGGNATIGAAISEAFMRGGRNGVIHIIKGDTSTSLGITVVDAGEDEDGVHEQVVVRGESEVETMALYARSCNALHAGVGSIAQGIVPGGGVAYALAADSLRDETDEDSVTGLAAYAVRTGLEVPLRLRTTSAGLNPDAILTAIHNDPTLAFDQTKPGLVPVTEGPIDPARIVAGVIREAGRTACDLLRLAL